MFDTKLLRPEADPAALDAAAALLQAGEVVGLPTETVYGLGANALDGAAVRKIFAAKGRPQDNPLIVHIAEFEQIYMLTDNLPPLAHTLADAFWPGPLTLVIPRGKNVPDETAAGLPSVGVRLPAHPVARELIARAGVPIAAPSANRSGQPSPTTAAHVMRDLGGKIPAVVDGGACTVGVESTVLSLLGDVPHLLRPGGITLEQLRAVLGPVTVDRALTEAVDEAETVSSPGMKYRHYAPRAPVTAVCGAPEASASYIRRHAAPGTGVLCFDEYRDTFPGCTVFSYGAAADSAAQARNLFDRLRAFDDTAVEAIFAQCPADEGIGLAVANRMRKAAGFAVVNAE